MSTGWSPRRDSAGFYVGSRPNPTNVFIESDRIDECMAYFYERGFTSISISPFMGFHNGDLEFLKDHPDVRGISLLSVEKIDISGLRFLEKSLEKLTVSDNRQSLDLSRFPKLEEFRGDWHPKLSITPECQRLRVLYLCKYKPKSKDLTKLPPLPELEDLEFVQGNLVSLKGIGRYPKLERLELSYLTKLKTIAGIQELRDGQLETLDCENCKKIQDHASVKDVASLKLVKFNDCGEIPNIGFLNDMPNIENFRFVGTNVLDGDLNPLLRLRSTGFTNKKHFSHTSKEIEAIFAERAASIER